MKYKIGDCLTLDYPGIPKEYLPVVYLKIIGIRETYTLEYILYNIIEKHELSYSVQNFDKIFYYRYATLTEITLYFN